jgi:uncharacterized protein
MKRAVIVHCWDGKPQYCWYPRAKKELEENGFEVAIPEMPEAHLPKLSSWLPKLQEDASIPDKELYLIGHSLGCITILRYLEQLTDEEKVGGVILVAGFTDDLSDVDPIEDELKSFFETPILWNKIKAKANKFVAIHSDDDPFVAIEYGDIFKKQLGAKLIIKHKMGHFSGEVGDSKSVTELADVTKELLRMVK